MSIPARPIENSHSEYGRTAAEVMAFLSKSDLVLVAVRVGDGVVTYLQFEPEQILDAVYGAGDANALPCEWRSATRELIIGSSAAITHAAKRERV